MCIVEDHSEGTVSQIFYLGSSFYFMESDEKFPVF